MLEFGGNYDAHAAIRNECYPIERPDFTLSSFVSRVPDGKMKDECCYGEVTHDPYGKPLTYVRADALTKCLVTQRSQDTTMSHRQSAAARYVEQLPPETAIALYWH